ncbi:MAG: signal peptidase I [Eubacterium sp.]|nr:signal peptidase I [Eubacterium sp.]
MNLRFEEEAKKEKRKKLIIELVRYLIEVILVILLAWVIINFTMKKVIVIGSAMENMLNSGQEVIVNTITKHLFSPGRGTVIAFYPEKKSSLETSLSDSNILIRRIVGLPGEKIHMEDGVVYADNKPIEESYEFDRHVSAGQAEEPMQLGEDEYFVLSDKRTDLDDSRSSSFTKVKKGNIVGSVFMTLNPFSFVSGPEPEKETEEEKDS